MKDSEFPIGRRTWLHCALGAGIFASQQSQAQSKQARTVPETLLPPVIRGPWLLPATGERPAEPIWGFARGLRVGLWPLSGPRGLFRIYTPYLGQPERRMVNYIAIEPVVRGVRCYSELEDEPLDRQTGKRLWTSASRNDQEPRQPWHPVAGTVTTSRQVVDSLSVVIHCLKFKNGAHPIVEMRFQADRPHEVRFRVFHVNGTANMDACILTATMGNYPRLRELWLNNEVITAKTLWPDYKPEGIGFAPAREVPASKLLTRNNEIIVAATSDEADPARASYDRAVPPHWRYTGQPATHYWKATSQRDLRVRVNGRATFWATQAPIPGGISYENFELEAPYAAGQEFIFGVSPDSPQTLGFAKR